jgi:hypothetical protein
MVLQQKVLVKISVVQRAPNKAITLLLRAARNQIGARQSYVEFLISRLTEKAAPSPDPMSFRTFDLITIFQPISVLGNAQCRPNKVQKSAYKSVDLQPKYR